MGTILLIPLLVLEAKAVMLFPPLAMVAPLTKSSWPPVPEKILVPMESKIIGDFIVRPFDVRHDAAEPLGFIVEHQELGRLAFVTDTRMVPYTFKSYKLDHIMIEANYSDFILDERVEDGVLEIARAARTRNTHMSIDSAIDFVCTNETERLKNVILIHLSGQNSAPHSFVKKMRDMILFANVIAARPGLEVELKPNDF